MSNHSNVVGGSTAARVIQCPGSIKLCAAVKKDTSNEHTRRGTLLHECMEVWMDSNEWPEIGWQGSDPEHPPLTQGLLDTKLRPAALAYIEFEDSLPEGEVMTERRVELVEIEDAFGTMDVILQGEKLALVDWKFGDGVIVEAEWNKQLMFGACGVLDEIDGWNDYPTVTLAIIQPTERRENPLSVWECPVDELAQFYTDLEKAVQNGLSDEPSFETGDACRFCEGTVNCPLMNSTFHEMVESKAEVIEAPNGVVEVNELADAQIADLLIQAEDVQLFIKALQAEAMERIETGIDFPEWKLVAKRVTRKWEDEGEAEAWFRLKKVRVCDMKKQVLKSPAQMEKITKRDFSHLLHQGEPGVTLARSGDKRPALNFTLTEDLKEAFPNE